MLSAFSAWSALHWIVLGLVLLACEMLGTAGYLLWLGVAALTVALLLWLIPLTLAVQWALFAVFSVVASLLWWRWQHGKDKQDQQHTQLNQRGNTLIGRQGKLTEPVQNGIGRLTLGDTTWRIQSDTDLPADCVVEVVFVSGITLHVKEIPV
ncbi:NfeD family protein [Plesiomonas sp.]|uniref:NfeD family protein n=1 Tax=Plesiomonas sp. TaxID=2486279 RepID=UPI003F35C083